ncbi:MAG: zinc ribbon domain-containing protein [Firmicutes bacterium]|nr:zinc ribbon domain-containing protein [Bacillota bacterium]
MTCKKCGADTNGGNKYCGKCGGKFVQKCKKCGAKVTPGAVFCNACGFEVNPPHKNRSADSGESVQIMGEYAWPPIEDDVPKPRFYQKRGVKRMSHVLAAWIFAALFLGMFGLVFGSFLKVEMPGTPVLLTDENGTPMIHESGKITVRVSALDAALTALSGKRPYYEVFNDVVNQPFETDRSAADNLAHAYRKAGVLNLLYPKEAVEAAPFTSRLTLTLYAGIALAALALSAAFFLFALVQAVKITFSNPGSYNRIRACSHFSVTAAFALCALLILKSQPQPSYGVITTRGNGAGVIISAGPGMTAMLWISVAALVSALLFNIIFTGRRHTSHKKLVSALICAAAASVLLVTLAEPSLSIGLDNKTPEAHASGIYRYYFAYEAIDNAISGKDSPYHGFTYQDAAGWLADGVVAEYENEALEILHPANAAFLEGAKNTSAVRASALAVLTLAGFYAAAVFAAFLLGHSLNGVANMSGDIFSKKRRYALMMTVSLLALTAAAFLTAVMGSNLSANADLPAGLSATYKTGFFVFINAGLALFTLAQKGVLGFGKK